MIATKSQIEYLKTRIKAIVNEKMEEWKKIIKLLIPNY